MANPLRGEVSFQALGETFTLLFSINALVTLEDRLDIGVADIGPKMASGMRLGFMRTLFWAGLQQHHPGISEDEAGDVIGDIGAARAGELLGEAFMKAFPQEAANATARPPKAAAGSGRTRS